MESQAYIQKLLQEKLSEMQTKNPSYSIRAFSQKMGVSHSAVSEILNGKRAISAKMARRLSTQLMLDPSEQAKLLTHFNKSAIKESKKALELAADNYHIISDWHHFAILSYLEIRGSKKDIDGISSYFKLSKKKTEAAVNRLLRLGMLKKIKDNYRATGKSYNSPDGTANASLKKNHTQNAELAKASIQKDPVDLRDFNSITMAINPKKIPEAKIKIREFRDSLCELLESGSKKEVYKFCMQLIPLKNKGDEYV